MMQTEMTIRLFLKVCTENPREHHRRLVTISTQQIISGFIYSVREEYISAEVELRQNCTKDGKNFHAKVLLSQVQNDIPINLSSLHILILKNAAILQVAKGF